MSGIAEWLRDSALNNALESSGYWLVPLLQIFHILAIAIVISSMILVNGRLVHAGVVNMTVERTIRRFLPWVWVALVVLLLSGLILILMEPVRTLEVSIFWFKMLAVVLAVVMTFALHRDVRRRPHRWTNNILRPTALLFAAVNLLLWVFIIYAGRWIAYA